MNLKKLAELQQATLRQNNNLAEAAGVQNQIVTPEEYAAFSNQLVNAGSAINKASNPTNDEMHGYTPDDTKLTTFIKWAGGEREGMEHLVSGTNPGLVQGLRQGAAHGALRLLNAVDASDDIKQADAILDGLSNEEQKAYFDEMNGRGNAQTTAILDSVRNRDLFSSSGLLSQDNNLSARELMQKAMKHREAANKITGEDGSSGRYGAADYYSSFTKDRQQDAKSAAQINWGTANTAKQADAEYAKGRWLSGVALDALNLLKSGAATTDRKSVV